jgi:hypothetical protein
MTIHQTSAALTWSQDEPPSLNLTPQRGPSVWAELHKKPSMSMGQLAAVAGGALLIASSVRQRSSRDAWVAALGMGCIAGVLVSRSSFGFSLWFRQSQPAYDAIDQTSDDSFPASDPPSSMQVE